jgi:hypothetical protein
MVKINLNFGNKTFYIIIILAVILVVGGFVIAYGENNPPVMGHSLGELDASQCANGQVLKKTSGVWACGDDTGGTIDSSVWQKRVNGTCPSGQAIKLINTDGTVSCGNTCTDDGGYLLVGSSITTPMSAGNTVLCTAGSSCTCPGVTTSGTPTSVTHTCTGGGCAYCTYNRHVCS